MSYISSQSLVHTIDSHIHTTETLFIDTHQAKGELTVMHHDQVTIFPTTTVLYITHNTTVKLV